MLIKYNQFSNKKKVGKYYFHFEKNKKVLKKFDKEGNKEIKFYDCEPVLVLGENIKIISPGESYYVLIHKKLGAFSLGRIELSNLILEKDKVKIKLQNYRIYNNKIVLKDYSKFFEILIFDEEGIKNEHGFKFNDSNIIQLKSILKRQTVLDHYACYYNLVINKKNNLEVICYDKRNDYYSNYTNTRILFTNLNFKINFKYLNQICFSEKTNVFYYQNYFYFIKENTVIKKIKIKKNSKDLENLGHLKYSNNIFKINRVIYGSNIDNKKLNCIIVSDYNNIVYDVFESKIYNQDNIKEKLKKIKYTNNIEALRNEIRRMYLIGKFGVNSDL